MNNILILATLFILFSTIWFITERFITERFIELLIITSTTLIIVSYFFDVRSESEKNPSHGNISTDNRVYADEVNIINNSGKLSYLATVISVLSLILIFFSILPLYSFSSPAIIVDVESNWWNSSDSGNFGYSENENPDFILVRQIIMNPSNSKFDINLESEINITIIDELGVEKIVIGKTLSDGKTKVDKIVIKPGESFDYIIRIPFKDNNTIYESGVYNFIIENKYNRVSSGNMIETIIHGKNNEEKITSEIELKWNGFGGKMKEI